MKILLVEPETSGHFISLYVYTVLKSLKGKANIYLLTSKKILKLEIFKILKSENKNLKLLFCEDLIYTKNKFFLNLFLNQFKNYKNLLLSIKKYNKKIKFDKILFTNLDHIDKAACFFSDPFDSLKFSGILVNPRVHQYENKKISLKYLIYKYLLNKLVMNKNLEKIYSNDILFYNFSKKNNLYKKICFFNEPVNLEKKKSKIKNSIIKNYLNVLVYGAIRNSKSLEELIDITQEIKKSIKINIIVAGAQNHEANYILKKKNLKKKNVEVNFKIINRFIHPNEETYLFSNVDVVWCVYKNTPLGSSGVFHISNNYQKPVLTNNLGLVGWYNKKYKLGPVLKFKNSKDFNNSCKSIIELHTNQKKYKYYKQNQSRLYNQLKKQKKLEELIRQDLIKEIR